jgi:hypothetical protein
VKNGANPDEKGVHTTGTLYLHEGGLRAAWSAAMGARSGRKADAAVVKHLEAHRKALGIDDSKQYYATLNGGEYEVFVQRAIADDDEGEIELYEKAEGMKLAEGVFKKSIQERGSVAAIPVEMVLGKQASVVIDFEVIQERDCVIVEAKILSATVTLPTPTKADAPTDDGQGRDGTKDGDGNNEGATDTVGDVVPSLEELEVEMLDQAARIASL